MGAPDLSPFHPPSQLGLGQDREFLSGSHFVTVECYRFLYKGRNGKHSNSATVMDTSLPVNELPIKLSDFRPYGRNATTSSYQDMMNTEEDSRKCRLNFPECRVLDAQAHTPTNL
mmetsp:Transcript_512/g.879  ORF Transcript_512/g.879 Transcript_512/m.879 type:complete len:115 (-) Transcript_512:1505-1849(-)